MHGLHKNLDWLSRYLFDLSGLPFGPPIQTVDISREPYIYRDVRQTFPATVVGANTMDVLTPVGRQRLYLWGDMSGGPAFSMTDDLGLSILAGGLVYPVWTLRNITAALLNQVMVIRGQIDDLTGLGRIQYGARFPVFVPGGASLRFDLIAAAAGLTPTFRGLCVDLPEYAPFPPVF